MKFKSLVLLAAAAALVLLVGCTRQNEPISQANLPLLANTPVAVPLKNGQTLRVTILEGHFVSTLYEEVTGATQMLVITEGGPYVFEIDNLVPRREVAANAETMITYDLSSPGQNAMRAYRSTPSGTSPDFASAVLQVNSIPGIPSNT